MSSPNTDPVTPGTGRVVSTVPSHGIPTLDCHVQPYTDPIAPDTWQGSLYSVSFEVPGCSEYTGTCQRTWCRSGDQAVQPGRGPLLNSLFHSISWTEGLTYTQLSMAEDREASCWCKLSRESRMQTLCLLLSRPSPDHQAT